ncbi:MAG: KilA-N domain-containing protein [Methyloprofundus sp.]|nr:KilA-N domain-containing protein [Methyloprofundus sp.]
MKKTAILTVQNTAINLKRIDAADYLSLTDIARAKNPDEPKDVVKNWLRSRQTIDFIGLWEQINNPDFKGVEFDSFRNQAGLNSFTLSPTKWIENTNATGLVSKSGRNGGTFAHPDIAFEFASWISAEFKLFLIKEFQRLKQDEIDSKQLEWNLNRSLSKINYRIHTDAIQAHIVPKLNPSQVNFTYADEADLLNLALFGVTAKQWREQHPDKQGNLRDYASVEELVILSNMESYNAEMIKQALSPEQRLVQLNQMAISQMNSLLKHKPIIENSTLKIKN